MLVLGGIGVFLPVWPTTPFVLVAAGCFSRSPRLSAWLCRTRFFREYIENYRNGCGISGKTKALSLVFLWGMLGCSAWFVRKPLVWTILLTVGISVTIHILVISRKRNELSEREDFEVDR